jgi:two-component system sensor histidine kinase BaeS
MAVGRDLAVQVAASDPVWAWGDADRTRHVLLNLASNAVRYTARGSVTLAGRYTGTMAGVSVADTGPGIAQEHIARIFDRFYRIDQSRSRAFGGAGLGLAIARLLAELQGGTIAVESAPGQGSTFTLWLPRADGPAEAGGSVPGSP